MPLPGVPLEKTLIRKDARTPVFMASGPVRSSRDVEAASVSIDRGLDQEGVHTRGGILLSRKEK